VTTKVRVSPVSNARDSLERVARNLQTVRLAEAWALKGAVIWAWHAVELLFYVRVSPERGVFDQWVQDYFHYWETDINVSQDIGRENIAHLGLLQILDLLSDRELPSLRPEFYQGWRDRVSRCQELRAKVFGVIGATIDGDQRDQLLYLLAVYNRLLYVTADASQDKKAVVDRMPALLDLIEMLWDRSWAESDLVESALKQSRSALSG
jgi:hypothetical protein